MKNTGRSLGQQPPLSSYRSSIRPYPEKLPPVEYEPGERVLKVRINGQVHLKGRTVFVSECLAGEYVGICPARQKGILDIIFINKTVRQVDLRQLSEV
jgi:hypothetical protein